jgi:hypothetical protein
MTNEVPEKYSADEWEHIRKRFSESILKKTEIAELGRSVGISWPFKGNGETPEKYIQFNFEELQNVPGLIGKKKRVADLMDVLREILAFDDPFSSMMDTVENKSENRVYKRALKKLEIPENYPISLMFFSSKTKKLLHENGIKTLLEAIRFGERLSENNDDLNSLISGLGLVNKATIKKHLPIRIGQLGLHLPEATGLMVRNIEEPIRLKLLIQAGLVTSGENPGEEAVKSDTLETPVKLALVRFKELCSWFSTQADELRKICDSPESIERYFLPINDAELERVAIALAMLHFGAPNKTKDGMFKKVSNLFKR